MDAGAHLSIAARQNGHKRPQKFLNKIQTHSTSRRAPFWRFPRARHGRTMASDELTYFAYSGEVVSAKESIKIRIKILESFNSPCLIPAQPRFGSRLTGEGSLTATATNGARHHLLWPSTWHLTGGRGPAGCGAGGAQGGGRCWRMQRARACSRAAGLTVD
jgi:hypothetical protein